MDKLHATTPQRNRRIRHPLLADDIDPRVMFDRLSRWSLHGKDVYAGGYQPWLSTASLQARCKHIKRRMGRLQQAAQASLDQQIQANAAQFGRQAAR